MVITNADAIWLWRYFRLPTLVTELEFQAQPLMHSKEGTVTTDADMQHTTNNDTDLQAGDSRFCAVRHIRLLQDSKPQFIYMYLNCFLTNIVALFLQSRRSSLLSSLHQSSNTYQKNLAIPFKTFLTCFPFIKGTRILFNYKGFSIYYKVYTLRTYTLMEFGIINPCVPSIVFLKLQVISIQ